MAFGGLDVSIIAPALQRGLGLASLLLVITTFGCSLTRSTGRQVRVDPLRISEVASEGDARRRASTQLVLEGLDAELDGNPDEAEARFARATQLDSTNPYAYLALARHRAEGTDPESALPLLDQAAMRLDADDLRTPGADVHLEGIRGAVLYATGRYADGALLLQKAHRAAPSIWSDGRLDPGELR